ncbi:hypothetical protein DL769_009914 [Monosporascus sp. CRB-8-3]|nr:hypothetical protein DL769_009914 [Monosporascus sp. CRB-8-3]
MHFFATLTLLPLALAAPAEPLKDTAPEGGLQDALAKAGGADKASHVYEAGRFKGFASKLDGKTLDSLQNHPDVEWIEQDSVVNINKYVSQRGAPWGLGRISHREKGSNTYVYDDSAGEGTCAYVIDTGIYTDHEEFGGRATFLANYIDNDNTDGNGHGTHVAGTIGGSTYGISKKTKLYAVKVLDSNGSGSVSDVTAGMNFVTEDAPTRNCTKGSVANMSLGGSFSYTLNFTARAIVEAGVFLAVAAGNDARDAYNDSPASEPSVCTVGASDQTDSMAYFSNFGSIVDIFAPGVDILSSYIGGKTATNTLSGTSMATPHITGLGAYLLTLLGKKSPTELCSYMQSIASSGVLASVPNGTKNLLAFNGNPSS